MSDSGGPIAPRLSVDAPEERTGGAVTAWSKRAPAWRPRGNQRQREEEEEAEMGGGRPCSANKSADLVSRSRSERRRTIAARIAGGSSRGGIEMAAAARNPRVMRTQLKRREHLGVQELISRSDGVQRRRGGQRQCLGWRQWRWGHAGGGPRRRLSRSADYDYHAS